MKWFAVIPWFAAAAVLLPVFLAGCALGYLYARGRARGELHPARVAVGEVLPIRSSSITGAELAMDLAVKGVPPQNQRAFVRRLCKLWALEPIPKPGTTH